jgi:Flp pilus assembly protein TadG
MKSGKQRGVAAIELALIIGPMMIALFGVTELGRALYQYNALVKSTRTAVRYFAQQDLDNLTAAERSAVYSKTVALAVCADVTCGSKEPVVPGLSTGKVSLCDYLTCADSHKSVMTGQGTVDLVSVSIGGTGNQAFRFESLVPGIVPSFSFSAIKTTMASR